MDGDWAHGLIEAKTVTSDKAARRRYEELIARIRETVRTVVPADATVLVVSKGDEELLKLGPCRGRHFPQDGRGGYAGFHPAEGAAAIAHLEGLRDDGADYLLFPSTAFWWLDYYRDFQQHLRARYAIVRQDVACLLWKLNDTPRVRETEVQTANPETLQLAGPIREIVASLLPAGAKVLVVSKGDDELVKLGECRGWHFPQDAHGAYSGFYPEDGAAAVAHLEALRARGAEYLLLPQSAYWWLDHYDELRRHLRSVGKTITHQENVCRIVALAEPTPNRAGQRRPIERHTRPAEAV
jgi:hypothetical protein